MASLTEDAHAILADRALDMRETAVALALDHVRLVSRLRQAAYEPGLLDLLDDAVDARRPGYELAEMLVEWVLCHE